MTVFMSFAAVLLGGALALAENPPDNSSPGGIKPRKGEEESIDVLNPSALKNSAPRPGLSFENGRPVRTPANAESTEKNTAAESNASSPASAQTPAAAPTSRGHFDYATIIIIGIAAVIVAILVGVSVVRGGRSSGRKL